MKIYKAIEALSNYEDHNTEFTTMMKNLAKNNLLALIGIAEFRQILEKDELKDTLRLVIQAVETANLIQGKILRSFTQCLICNNIRDGNFGYAPCIKCASDSARQKVTLYREV